MKSREWICKTCNKRWSDEYETAELVEKLKAKNINISKAFCTALVAYWEKKFKE
jgi:hypothetical protein